LTGNARGGHCVLVVGYSDTHQALGRALYFLPTEISYEFTTSAGTADMSQSVQV
jgi:hypothetical protein